MSKENGGFLRKVARFVTNPTTDWAELDTPSAEAAESEYAKTEIKAMIERKRRNDFVRKRELDMLRKIRREGLSPDNALALGNPSNLDPDSRPQNGTRSDIAVKAKIDAIEQQMVGGNARSPAPPPAPVPPRSASGRPGDAITTITAPDQLTSPATLAYDMDEPGLQISQAVLDSARASMPRMPHTEPPLMDVLTANSIQDGLDMPQAEVEADMAHDPELDEAVIAFANADFDQCERCLLELVHPGAIRHDDPNTWLVLFDFYRTLDLPQKFDNLAVSYAQKFGVSAPQWYSFPQKVADFIASTGAVGTGALNTEHTPHDTGMDTEAGPDALHSGRGQLEGWIAPALLDPESVAQLRVEVLQMPRPWTMDWSRVSNVTPEGAGLLGQLMRQWALEKQDLVWMGAQPFTDLLGELSPSGVRDADPAYWMLRLDVLRLCNRPTQFDEVAIDYCVTYELSPPSWEPALCHVRMSHDAISPHSRSLSRVSEVTTSFIESQIHRDVEFVQVATLNLSGQLVGDIGETLKNLDAQLGGSVSLDIDCEHLLRVDFIAAGDLLNWVLARRSEDRQVIFNNPHRLVAMFFGAMGINEHARVKLRNA